MTHCVSYGFSVFPIRVILLTDALESDNGSLNENLTRTFCIYESVTVHFVLYTDRSQAVAGRSCFISFWVFRLSSHTRIIDHHVCSYVISYIGYYCISLVASRCLYWISRIEKGWLLLFKVQSRSMTCCRYAFTCIRCSTIFTKRRNNIGTNLGKYLMLLLLLILMLSLLLASGVYEKGKEGFQ